MPPVSKGRAGGDQRHLPYRDYAGGEDISKSEQLPNCSVLVRHPGITLWQAAECGLCKGPSPFAGSLRACPESVEGVSLRYNLPHSLHKEGASKDGRGRFFRSLLPHAIRRMFYDGP